MPSNLNLDYYYGTEADQYSFYRIPKTLLTDPRYKSVSIEAKVLYGLNYVNDKQRNANRGFKKRLCSACYQYPGRKL